MKPKTTKLIARIIVIFLAVLMILGAISPLVLGKEKYVSYSNDKLHMSMRIPSSAKKNMEKISDNSREFSANFNLTVRVTYGDIYEETLAKLKLDKDKLKREQVYIESDFAKETWNNKKYVTNYFKDILGDAKSEYTFEVSQTKLSGIKAWRCYYKGKTTKSTGYYYLTVTNAGLHVLQLDCYLESISKHKNDINKIKDSYKITDLVIPKPEDRLLSSIKTDKKVEEEKPKTKEVKEEADNENALTTNGEDAGISVFSYFLGGIFVLAIMASIVIYITKQNKYKKMKSDRRKLRVKRRNNDKI